MTDDNKKETSLIPTGVNGLFRVQKSIEITNKILGEISMANIQWWRTLGHEWQKIFYANYKIQKEYSSERLPYYSSIPNPAAHLSWKNRLEALMKRMYANEISQEELIKIEASSFDPDERIHVLNRYEELFGQKIIINEKISGAEVNDILKINSLDCCNTKFDDYSPIAKFKNLTQLFLNKSTFRNFEEIIPALSKLNKIEFYDSAVTDISAFNQIDSLKFVQCSNNKINDISPLQFSKNLWWLDCTNTLINNIDCLKNLKIQKLWLSNTNVIDLRPLKSMQNSLAFLMIDGCKIGNESISVLANFNLMWCVLSNTQITDISFLKNYSRLEVLHIKSTQIRDISSIIGLTKLKELVCKNVDLIEGQLEVLEKINPSCKIVK